jgi:hypothetical protein
MSPLFVSSAAMWKTSARARTIFPGQPYTGANNIAEAPVHTYSVRVVLMTPLRGAFVLCALGESI